MEYLEYLEDIFFSAYEKIPYVLSEQKTHPHKDYLRSFDSKIESIIVSYLNLERVLDIYENDYKLERYLKLYFPRMPTLRQASILGKINTFKYLVKNGNVPTPYDLMIASQKGHLDILKFLVSLDMVPDRYLMDEATRSGQLDIVKYLVSIGIQPTSYTIELAPEGSSVIKYLKELLDYS